MSDREQEEQYRRVSRNISALVFAFCREREGKEFHGAELERYVVEHGNATYGSAARILRGLADPAFPRVQYTVVNRAQSLYRVDAVSCGVECDLLGRRKGEPTLKPDEAGQYPLFAALPGKESARR